MSPKSYCKNVHFRSEIRSDYPQALGSNKGRYYQQGKVVDCCCIVIIMQMQTNHKKQESFSCETRLWSVVTQRKKVPCFWIKVVTDMFNFKVTSIDIFN